jgi:arylsulfatase A-like enzyme
MSWTRRQVFSLPLVLAAQTNERPPNIVLILADDMSGGDLSCYGARDVRTPNIDLLASRGMRFTRFYSNSPVCSPTRAALMTGFSPDLVGVPGVIRTHSDNSWGYLSPSAVLLPQHLKTAGYTSALIGKWHLGLESPNTPNERGFDFFHGFLGDMMDDYVTHRRFGQNYMRRNREAIDPPGHATDLFTNWAVDYVRQPRQQPFFLYLAYNAPHVPVQPPEEWLQKVNARDPGLTPARAKFAALVEHLDESIGKVVRALEESGQAQNTVILFASDNGGEAKAGANSGGLRGSKQAMYEGGIRVPFLAVWPNHIRPGSTAKAVAQASDLFPTVCAMARAAAPRVDGVSLLPVLTGATQDLGERTLFWVRREGGAPYYGQEYYAVRRGPWKLLHNGPFEPLELYNLDEDETEQNNRIKTDPAIAKELIAALSAHIQRAGRVPWQSPR